MKYKQSKIPYLTILMLIMLLALHDHRSGEDQLITQQITLNEPNSNQVQNFASLSFGEWLILKAHLR